MGSVGDALFTLMVKYKALAPTSSDLIGFLGSFMARRWVVFLLFLILELGLKSPLEWWSVFLGSRITVLCALATVGFSSSMVPMDAFTSLPMLVTPFGVSVYP